MFIEGLGDLNWLAVIVATIAWFAFSAIWYSVPPISAAWIRASRITPPDTSRGNMPPPSTIIGTFLGYLVTVIVIGLFTLGFDDVGVAIELGVLLGIGFGTVNAFITQIYEQKGPSYWLINGINAIVAYSIVSVILTIWD